ncbi:MAG: helix-turn-helix transcriptional regulator, partial [Paracoccaceae bacterium]|nr:helix-turn-helix transcriptional regulator [Paracoccaceae bacterium]
MSKTTLTGSRVRERRLTLGMRQAAVAKSAGISASYLNLIEHNRRRIGPDVLARLAQALAVDLAILSEVAEAGVVQDLRAVAALNTTLKVELDRLEEFLDRFPGWAAVLVDVFRKATVAQNMVVALSDRMSHDPQLSAALHEVLSAISAVRASSDILTDVQDIDPEWRAKFLKNLNGDSRRLSRGAEVLVTYLDAPDKTSEAPLASATEQFDAWLTERDWHLCA